MCVSSDVTIVVFPLDSILIRFLYKDFDFNFFTPIFAFIEMATGPSNGINGRILLIYTHTRNVQRYYCGVLYMYSSALGMIGLVGGVEHIL